MEEYPDLPEYTDVEAVFKQRKTTEEKIQMIASCTLNGKTRPECLDRSTDCTYTMDTKAK